MQLVPSTRDENVIPVIRHVGSPTSTSSSSTRMPKSGPRKSKSGKKASRVDSESAESEEKAERRPRQVRPQGPRSARGRQGARRGQSGGTRQRSRLLAVSDSIHRTNQQELGNADAMNEIASEVQCGGGPPHEPTMVRPVGPPAAAPPAAATPLNPLESAMRHSTENPILCVRSGKGIAGFVSPILSITAGILWRLRWRKASIATGIGAMLTSRSFLAPFSNWLNDKCTTWMSTRLVGNLPVSNQNMANLMADRVAGPSRNAHGMGPAQLFSVAHYLFFTLGIQNWYSVGMIYPTHSTIADRTNDDYRAPHLRAGRAEPDRVVLSRHEHVDLQKGTVDVLLACPEMVDQVATRVEMMPLEDATKVAQVLAARVGNLMIPKMLYSQSVSGSALVATELAARSAAQRDCYADDHTHGFYSRIAVANFLGTTMLGPVERSLARLFKLRQFSLDMCTTVPIYEELLKLTLRRMGLRRAGLAFGLFEYVVRQSLPGPGLVLCLPALVMHIATDYLSPECGLAIHSGFNLVCQLTAGMLRPAGLLGTLGVATALSFAAVAILATYTFVRRPKRAKEEEPMLFAYGYRPLQDGLVAPDLPPHSAKVRTGPSFDVDTQRKPMQLSLGPVVCGIAPPTPDRGHGPTALRGCLKRFCSNPPPANPALLRELKEFTEQFVRKHFRPLDPDHNLDFETWVSGTTYPEYRKQELREVHHSMQGALKKSDLELKGFIKNETYLDFKESRGINSRSDQYKTWVGPAFAAIEKVVYEHPAFIKHVPVPDRAQYIISMLGHFPGPFYETDYTAFERHFTPDVMDALEFVLYRHMLQNHPALLETIIPVLAGENTIYYRHFRLKIHARRMSGEMCTSLGNGFSNLMLAEFVAHKQGMPILGIVEGDDGLFYTRAKLSEEIFQSLGFTIKILTFPSLLRTTFCGLTMADDLTMLSDPIKVLANFGWTHSPQMWGGLRVRRELLRAKALSLLYERPNCPILSALAKRIIDITGGYGARFGDSWYERYQQKDVLDQQHETLKKAAAGPTDIARRDFEEIYGIPVHIQVQCEAYLSTVSFQPMRHWTLDFIFSTGKSQPLQQYWTRYVQTHQHAY